MIVHVYSTFFVVNWLVIWSSTVVIKLNKLLIMHSSVVWVCMCFFHQCMHCRKNRLVKITNLNG
jgi:hypothetical protein